MHFHYVYFLQDLQDKSRIYIGETNDLERRLAQHKSGAKHRGYTSGRKWRLVYYEAFLSKEDAQLREKRLKQHGLAKRHVLKRIEQSLSRD